MPCLKFFTSIAKDKIPENFIHRIVPVLSKVVRKPEDKFTVMVSPGCEMIIGGQTTQGPSAVATLESIGHLGLHENKVIIKEVTDFIEKELGISPNNFLMTFYDISGQNIGIGGQTIA